MDHELVENLVLRGEIRYDQVSSRSVRDEFIAEGSPTTDSKRNQVTIGAQIAYIF